MNNVIKKVGIITHRGNYNYGGLLQALCMQRWLQVQNIDAELIDINDYNLSGSRLFQLIRPILEPKRLFKKLINRHKSNNAKQLPPDDFKHLFLDYKQKVGMKYSPKANRSNFGSVANEYDAIIIGSDQVWVYKYARPLIFFGQWRPKYNGRLISYAACSPDEHTPWYNKGLLSHLLKNFNEISVRDKTTQQWVKTLCDRESSIVVDPTLLYDTDTLTRSSIIEEPYIFTYCLGSEINGGNKNAINEIRKKYGNIKPVCRSPQNTGVCVVQNRNER